MRHSRDARTHRYLERLQRRQTRRCADLVGCHRPDFRPVHEPRGTTEIEARGGGKMQSYAEPPQRQRETSAAAEMATRQPWGQPVAAQYGTNVEVFGADE